MVALFGISSDLGDLGGVDSRVACHIDLVEEALFVQQAGVLLDRLLVPVPLPIVLVLIRHNIGVVDPLVLGFADDGGTEATHLRRLLALLPVAVLEILLRVLRKTPLLHISLLGDLAIVIYC